MDVFTPPYSILKTHVESKGQIIDYWHNLVKTSEVNIKGDKAVVYVLDTADKFIAEDLPKEGNIHAFNATGQGGDLGNHGHLAAGMIAAQNNDGGVLGVSPDTLVIPVKALHVNSGLYDWIIKGLDYIKDHFVNNFKGEKIGFINMSFGANSPHQPLYNKIQECVNVGLVPVAAAGNDGGSVDWPGAWDDLCITVTALDRNINPPSWTSRGKEADIASFGVSVISTAPNNTYPRVNGTSFSTPLIAGVLALVATKHFEELVDAGKETKNLLEGHTKKFAKDILSPGEDEFGAGYTIIKPYLENPISEAPDEPDEPDYPEKEERTLTFIFNDFKILWGTTFGFGAKLLDLTKENLTSENQWLYIDRLVIDYTTTEFAEAAWQKLNNTFTDYFTNRGLLLFENSDINDAAYWTNYFMKMLIGRKGIKFDSVTMEVSDDRGTKLIWNDNNS